MAEERKIKQVLVVRADLNMRKGKVGAQCAHVAMMFMAKRFEGIEKLIPGLIRGGEDIKVIKFKPPELEWLFNRNFRKITLRVENDAELLTIYKAALDAGLESHLCTDDGLTEFSGVQTNTCIAIGPDFDEKIDPITRHLKPY